MGMNLESPAARRDNPPIGAAFKMIRHRGIVKVDGDRGGFLPGDSQILDVEQILFVTDAEESHLRLAGMKKHPQLQPSQRGKAQDCSCSGALRPAPGSLLETSRRQCRHQGRCRRSLRRDPGPLNQNFSSSNSTSRVKEFRKSLANWGLPGFGTSQPVFRAALKQQQHRAQS